jgi:hypothetical protein
MKEKEHEIVKKAENGEALNYVVCPRCLGTGLICACEPKISPGCCCADYANSICPECKGAGKILVKK